MLAMRSRSVSIGSTSRAFVRSLRFPSSAVGALIDTPELTIAGKASSPLAPLPMMPGPTITIRL